MLLKYRKCLGPIAITSILRGESRDEEKFLINIDDTVTDLAVL